MGEDEGGGDLTIFHPPLTPPVKGGELKTVGYSSINSQKCLLTRFWSGNDCAIHPS